MKELVTKIVEDGRLDLTEEQLAEVPETALTAIVKLLGALPEVSEEEVEAETEDVVKVEAETEEVPETQEDEAKAKVEANPAPQANERDDAQMKALMARIVALEAKDKAESVGRKTELTAALKANEDCAFTAAQLGDLSVVTLETLHRSLSPADYSGQGGGERKDKRQRPVGIRVAPHKEQEVK